MTKCLLVSLLTCAAIAAEPTPFPLWPGPPPADADQEQSTQRKNKFRSFTWISKVTWPTLTVFAPPADKATGAAVIICPGGGYAGLAYDLEGTDVAERFAAAGVTGIVLKYRMPNPKESGDAVPWPIADGQRAIQLIRSRASEWNLKTDRIGIMGFSAGGHLAATVSTHVVAADPKATDPILRVSSRPDFSVLVYPVVLLSAPVGHQGSAKNLLGSNPAPTLLETYNNDKHVTKDTPPAFLVHAANDGVKVANSERYDAALTATDVPHEFLRLTSGGHGFGLGAEGSEPAQWPDRCLAFLKARGFLAP